PPAISSYSARACQISFCAIDENATSSSRRGAMPVHSESRQPRISSSSAISSRCCCSRSFTCLLQLLLQRVAVDAVIVAVQLVDELVDLDHRASRQDPERRRLAAPSVLLAGVYIREVVVGRLDRAGVLQRLSFPFLAKDFVNQAASTISRTHAEFSRARRRRSSRSCDFGPCPVTTLRSSSQSGSVYLHTPSSSLRNFGSGTVSPSSQTCGT